MSNIHTHLGHCQLCDRLQAVNVKTGRLAKHGYSKQWGFFSGTCPGSDHLSYEQSTDLLPGAVSLVTTQVKALDAERTRVAALAEADPTFGQARFEATLPKKNQVWGRPREEQHWVDGHFVEESREEHGYGVYIRSKFVALRPVVFQDGTQQSELDSHQLYQTGYYYGVTGGPEGHTRKWREGVISSLNANLERHLSYRKWLERRLADWTLRDLTPRVA